MSTYPGLYKEIEIFLENSRVLLYKRLEKERIKKNICECGREVDVKGMCKKCYQHNYWLVYRRPRRKSILNRN